jgi:polysaccharide export outer membrane protein
VIRTGRRIAAAAVLLALAGPVGAQIFPDWWRQQAPPPEVPAGPGGEEPTEPAEDDERPRFIQELGVDRLRQGERLEDDPLDPERVARLYREPDGGDGSRYGVQPGDVLFVSVWKEPDLQREVIVSPDGWITFPLIGELQVAGLTVNGIRAAVRDQLERYVPDAVVDVALQQINGNLVFVLGKVARPGAFPIAGPVDVVKALSLAGGATRFADVDDIKVLRREDGQQRTFRFNYDDITAGRRLEQNIELQSGDIVLVP